MEAKKYKAGGILNVKNQLAANYAIRTELLEGRDHIIIPVVMMVEGVHHGNKGPILYTAEELGEIPESWNNIPVVVNHPLEEISASDPSISEEIVGRIFNATMDGLKLKAEAWVDITQLQMVSENALQHIQDQLALEVSIGVFMDEELTTGEFNNEEYRAIAHHLRPDHLALLPDSIGACSWDDGCGVRLNKKGGIDVKDLKKLSIEEMLALGYVSNRLTENEIGFREIMTNVQQKLDQLDNSSMFHFLEELFDDHFIYRVHSRESGETKFFQRDFAVNEDGSVEFEGDPVEVRKDVSFETVNNVKSKLKTKMKRNNAPCKVDALIANKATQFTEDDRAWLDGLEDDQLSRLTPVDIEPEIVTDVANNATDGTEPEVEEEAPVATSEKDTKMSQEEFATNVKEVLKKDPEAFIENFMPGDLGRSIKSGLSMYNEKRENLIKGIVANSSFEEANLSEWKDDDLQKLYDSVIPEADFSAMGASNSRSVINEDDKEEIGDMIQNNNIKTNEE